MAIRLLITVLAVALVLTTGALAGGAGGEPDVLVGTTGSNFIHGGDGGDAIYGLAGNDVLFGDAGDDQVWGGPGDDVLYGGPGQDTLVGRWGNDRIYSRDGRRDFIHCGAGRDVVMADNADVIDVTCDKVLYPSK